jgi:hypothetical protein
VIIEPVGYLLHAPLLELGHFYLEELAAPTDGNFEVCFLRLLFPRHPLLDTWAVCSNSNGLRSRRTGTVALSAFAAAYACAFFNLIVHWIW